MTVQIQSIHFDADKKLIDFTQEKVNKLEVFYDKILRSEVALKIDKSDHAENKVAEIRVYIPGNDLFVKKQCKSFEEAVDLCVDALRKQITKHKEKAREI